MSEENKQVFVLDGARFDDLAGFYREITAVLSLSSEWGRNLDAWNDVLRGGMGTPRAGFVLVWKASARSRCLVHNFDELVEIMGEHDEDGVEYRLE